MKCLLECSYIYFDQLIVVSNFVFLVSDLGFSASGKERFEENAHKNGEQRGKMFVRIPK